PQLVHDVADVDFYGLLCNEETFGDFPIAVSPGHLLENLDLASGESVIAEMFSQLRCHLRRNRFLTSVDLTDSRGQLTRGHTFEHVATSSGFQRTPNCSVAFKCCQHDDACFGE